jgi:hypothetical protein
MRKYGQLKANKCVLSIRIKRQKVRSIQQLSIGERGSVRETRALRVASENV